MTPQYQLSSIPPTELLLPFGQKVPYFYFLHNRTTQAKETFVSQTPFKIITQEVIFAAWYLKLLPVTPMALWTLDPVSAAPLQLQLPTNHLK